MEWFSYTVAVILLISSIVSPWLITRENNKHQLKLKRLDFYESSKRQALENFIKYASQCYNGSSPVNDYNYYESLNNLYIYFVYIPENINNLKNYSGTSFINELTNIAQYLSKQITKT